MVEREAKKQARVEELMTKKEVCQWKQAERQQVAKKKEL